MGTSAFVQGTIPMTPENWEKPEVQQLVAEIREHWVGDQCDLDYEPDREVVEVAIGGHMSYSSSALLDDMMIELGRFAKPCGAVLSTEGEESPVPLIVGPNDTSIFLADLDYSLKRIQESSHELETLILNFRKKFEKEQTDEP